MAGLFYKGSVDGTIPERCSIIIKNNATIYQGSFCDFSDGNVIQPADAGDKLGFYVENFVTQSKYPLEEAENNEYDGTYTSGAEGSGNYVASADNQTDKKVKAIGFIPRPTDRFTSVPDDNIGTTTGSDSLGYYSDLINSYTVDEDTAGTTNGQLAIHGTDENDSTKGVYSVAENHFII